MNVLVLGGDKRLIYTAQRLSRSHSVTIYGSGGYNIAPDRLFDCTVLGLPCSKDGITVNAPLYHDTIPLEAAVKYTRKGGIIIGGMTVPALTSACNTAGVSCKDYYLDECLILKNAVLTAEGAVAAAISNTDTSLWGMNVIVTGYGRIAVLLARCLTALGADVTVAARKPSDRVKAQTIGCSAIGFDMLADRCRYAGLIFNTVPAAVFKASETEAVSPDSVYIELASKSGIDEALISDCPFRIINAQGLPSKTAPRSAGYIIADAVNDILNAELSLHPTKER